MIFRIRADLLLQVLLDLRRSHPFAWERVGFLSCKAAALPNGGLTVLASSYAPVDDDDYLDDKTVGAMMGPMAIRKALERAYNRGGEDVSMFHVHLHDHDGRPGFSRVDDRETRRFVPDFFSLAPMMPHGAIVLSRNGAVGRCWQRDMPEPVAFDRLVSVGAPLRILGDR